jgi:hypothetical protein
MAMYVMVEDEELLTFEEMWRYPDTLRHKEAGMKFTLAL